MPEHTNALADETSPYLLQHAHNPVNWNPWGEAALAQAESTDKLLIVSVGYAACHWCHVMERESFEDTSVAAVMNEHFVPIKVDREERPDVDDVYMTACHLSGGGSCGWPLNAIALPDGRPIWAGTYFPKARWIEILEYFVQLRRDEPEKLEAYATQIAEQLRGQGAQPVVTGEAEFSDEVAAGNLARFVLDADPTYGGFGGAPKFPLPVGYEFLLDQVAYGKTDTAHEALIHGGLLAMARGGIYDQLGGGFARYSVDAAWHAPHFEKMLYDNGQLVSAYARAYRLTQHPEYADVVRETLAFVARELTDEEGLFHSSLDADSEGEEGKFYVWTYAELDSLLSPEQVRVYETVYGVTERGNWEHGRNILHRTDAYPALAAQLDLPEPALRDVLADASARLTAARDERVRPGLDDKVLVSWNALTLKGYVDAYLALGDADYLRTARANARALETRFLQADGRLLRTSAKGKTHVNAFLDDYANLADAYLALYQATFDHHYLATAQVLVDYALAHFGAEAGALLHYTSDLDPALVARRTEDTDNVTPSSNSVMADVLLALGTLLDEDRYRDRAAAMVRTVLPSLAEARTPTYWSRWLQVHDRLAGKRFEVAVVGPDAVGVRQRLAARALTPRATYLGAVDPSGTRSLELLADKYDGDRTLIYVCENRVCQLPTEDVGEALTALGR